MASLVEAISQDDSAARLLRAAWIAPTDGPPIRNGGLVFQGGTIVAVGDSKLLAQRYPEAEIIDRPSEIVLPGLINAHTHLELSEFSCGSAPASFVDWILRLVPRGAIDLKTVQESVARSVPLGVGQCLQFGVTSVGDISRHCTVTRPLLTGGPLRVVSFGEVQAMAQRRGLLEQRLATAADEDFESEYLRTAISPHAPYSVEIDGYRRCVQVAAERAMPIATHLAETPDERPFLHDHSGRFRDLWDALQAWDDSVPQFDGGPIRFAKAVGLLDYEKTLLAHVNYCDEEEMDLLAAGTASVVYCPRTHAYFGHPPHRWREMLARGINVAVGTDSCASSPDLNLVDELRLLRRIAPEIPTSELWQMATVRGARAIAMQGRAGVLRPGFNADFALFPARGDDPLTAILDENLSVSECWIDGKTTFPPYHRPP
jgi:cytosine/adenosine deaminase-related metal-dependent hydrolase